MHFNQSNSPNRFPPISSASARILRIGLPVILLELLAFWICLRRDMQIDPIFVAHYYPLMLEHIMVGFTALVIGAFLFDYIAIRSQT